MKTLSYALLSVAAVAMCANAPSATAASGATGRSTQLIHEYSMPPFSLLNLGYTQQELDIAQANGLPFTDLPALCSGLQRLTGNHFLCVTDRGPNADRADGNKVFPMPQFTPTIMLISAVGDQIIAE